MRLRRLRFLSGAREMLFGWFQARAGRAGHGAILVRPPSHRARLGAFTLVELMVVLLVITIMSALIIPEMRGTFQEALLRSTARNLLDGCHLAYSQAISVHRVHRVRLDLQDGHYFVEVREQGREGEAAGFAPVRKVPGAQGVLDRRIAIELRPPPPKTDDQEEPEAPPLVEEKQPSAAAPREVIRFYPDGTADAMELQLRDRQGFRLLLRVNPITARVEVAEPDRS